VLRVHCWRILAVGAVCVSLANCGGENPISWLFAKPQPLELPTLITVDLPFRYPPGLYLEKIEGDVTLKLFIDSLGTVVRDSITVTEAAKYSLFDSAAVEGAPRLAFHPAKRGERRVSMAVLFPVKFRMPSSRILLQDTASQSTKR
jgi:TonB family protein